MRLEIRQLNVVRSITDVVFGNVDGQAGVRREAIEVGFHSRCREAFEPMGLGADGVDGGTSLLARVVANFNPSGSAAFRVSVFPQNFMGALGSLPADPAEVVEPPISPPIAP